MSGRDAANTGDGAPLGRYRDLGGRRLWLDRAGEGARPTVVVLPGAGAVGLDYFNVHQRAARHGASVLYDRSGTGFSGPALADRSAAATVSELRALLSLEAIKPPYVLVGHSLGGLFARRFAQLHPAEVAGLVLLDPAHEDYAAYMPDALNAVRRTGWASRLIGGASGAALGAAVRLAPGLVARSAVVRRYRDLYRGLFTAEFGEWPQPLREALVERHVSLPWLWTGIREAQNAPALYREMRAAGPTPDIPTIILCASEVDPFREAVSSGESPELLAAEFAGKRRLYDDLAAAMPRAEVRPVAAGHVTLSFRCPDAVEQAIADVLQM